MLDRKKFAWLLIGLGLLFYALSTVSNALLLKIVTTDTFIKIVKNISILVFDIIKLLSGVALSSGFLTLLLEISTVKDVVLDVYNAFMRQVLKANFDLSTYSKETLDNLQKNILIQKNDKKIDAQMLDDSVYVLEKNLNTLLLGLFYKNDDATYRIIPDEERQVFTKKVSISYTIFNYFKLKNNRIKFELNFDKNGSEDITKKINVTKFVINNTDLTLAVSELITPQEIPDKNKYRVIFEKPLQECLKHDVKIEYEYEVPMTDFTQSFKLLLPCKRFCHKILLDGKDMKNWELTINGFASFFYAESEIEDQFKVLRPTTHNAEIQFNKWILPGAGYVVSFRRVIQ